MSKAKNMLKSSIVYFIGRGLSGIVSILMLPIYTGRILPEEYGYYETVNSIVIFLIPVLCIEVWTGMLKYVLSYHSGDSKYSVKDIYSASFCIINLGCIVFIAGALLFYLISPFRYLGLVILCGISLALSCNEGYVARSEGKNAVYAISGIIGTFTNAISGIVCVYAFEMQAQALFLAYALGNIAQFVWLEINNKVFINKRIYFFSINKQLLKKLAVFCIPLGLNSIVYYLMNNFNKVVISMMMGNDYVGIFTVAGKFMAIATSVAAVIQYAWVELTFSLNDSDDKGAIYNFAMKVVTDLSLFLVVIMLPVIHILFPYLIGSDYVDAFPLIPVYYFSLGYTIISGFYVNIFRAEEDTKTGLYARIAACIVSLTILLLLTPILGLQGVGISISFGAVVEYVFLCIAARKYNVRFSVLKTVIFLLFYCLSSIAYFDDTVIYSFVFAILAVVLFAIYYRRGIFAVARRFLKKG